MYKLYKIRKCAYALASVLYSIILLSRILIEDAKADDITQ